MNMHTTEAALFDPAVNMARQSLYRFAALSLLDPRQGSWKNLRALREDRLLHESADFLRTLPEARPARLGVGELPLNNLDPGYVLARLPGSPELFNAEYESAFGLLVSCACPPHEIEYVPSKFDFQRSNGLADISGFYHAFGLTIADEHPERPDHIVLELEFMAFLLSLERRAAEFSNVERGQICREAQAMFLSEHLAWWAPAFARLLAREAADGFYAAVADFLAALIPAERALVGVEVPGRPAAPTQIERPEACEGCKIST